MELVPSTPEFVLRLAAAFLLGGLLGFERERKRKPAGLRTHMMVALGSATFTLVALEFYGRLAGAPTDVARVDPIRAIEGIIGGIGFLGAGAIIQQRGSVEGLTTAGSIWLVGAVGVACGGGHFLIAAVTATMALFILVVMGFLERRVFGRGKRPAASEPPRPTSSPGE